MWGVGGWEPGRGRATGQRAGRQEHGRVHRTAPPAHSHARKAPVRSFRCASATQEEPPRQGHPDRATPSAPPPPAAGGPGAPPSAQCRPGRRPAQFWWIRLRAWHGMGAGWHSGGAQMAADSCTCIQNSTAPAACAGPPPAPTCFIRPWKCLAMVYRPLSFSPQYVSTCGRGSMPWSGWAGEGGGPRQEGHGHACAGYARSCSCPESPSRSPPPTASAA